MTAPREPCAVAIVFAVAIEADPFARLAGRRVETRAAGVAIEEGTVAGVRVAWCVGGIGTTAAARAARLLVAGHRPRLLVTAGFAGGLDPALPRGAVVRPSVVLADGEPQGLPLASVPPLGAGGPPPATIVTAAGVVATPDEKRALAERTGAHLVDMETHAVARVAAEAGLPCAAIRVISDDAAEPLPSEIVALARPQSTLRRLGAALTAVGRRPAAARDLWRLYENAVVDAKTLAAALESLCADIAGEA